MEIHDRLRDARTRANYDSAAAAAEAMGVNYYTYIQHENGTRGITRKTAERYAKFYRVDLTWLLTGNSKSSIENTTSVVQVELLYLPVVGSVQAGTWVEVDQFGEGEWEQIPVVPDTRYPSELQFVVLVRGDSIDEELPEGTYAHCVSADCGRQIKNGDLVVVERLRAQGGLVETTIKEARINGHGVELWPKSSNPKHKGPIHLDNGEDNIEVRVKGFVIGQYRRR
ncbi:MAG: XRE family transcriptional regulator [Parvibaculaceae bacterium]|nr:XRE family transcriptional regulator [Parvibaculaceae bacterium]